MTSSKHAGDDASISPVRQAGAVAFRSDKGSGIEILLVRPSSGLKEWGFPKGHLEGDESVEQCALRELLEETGVKGRLVGGIDHISRFEHGGLKKAVRYFAVEWTADGSATEDRETLWLPMALAAEALTHQDNRLVLEGAAPVIHAHLAVTCLDGVRRFDDFMLAELGHVTESLFKSEEDGERRVVFFLTLAAGAGALLAFLLGKDATYLPGKQNPPAIMVFAALLTFGLFVLRRVIRRNAMTDGYKVQLARIRKWFAPNESDPRVALLAFNPHASDERIRSKPSFWKPQTGGWLDAHLLVCSLLVGVLSSAWINTPDWWCEAGVAAAGTLAGWLLLVALTRYVMNADRAKLDAKGAEYDREREKRRRQRRMNWH